jgi:hypothetical protein
MRYDERMPDPTELENALADFRKCAKDVQGNLSATPLDRLRNPFGVYMANFIRSGGELAVTGIEELARAAAAYLAAQQEESARAAEDRRAMKDANTAMAKWAKVYTIVTGIAVLVALITLYIQAHSGR